MLAGRLTGTLNGRPAVIEADAAGVVLSLRSLRTAWDMRRQATTLLPALGLLRQGRVALQMRVAGLPSVALLPRASLLARLAVPELGSFH